MIEVEWKSSLKETPRANKTVIAWIKVTGLASARRSKEGKWMFFWSDGQTIFIDAENIYWGEVQPPKGAKK